jgi:hypothetical protein
MVPDGQSLSCAGAANGSFLASALRQRTEHGRQADPDAQQWHPSSQIKKQPASEHGDGNQQRRFDSQRVTTYLRLMNLPMGLLINFGAPSFKQGVRRIRNGHAT